MRTMSFFLSAGVSADRADSSFWRANTERKNERWSMPSIFSTCAVTVRSVDASTSPLPRISASALRFLPLMARRTWYCTPPSSNMIFTEQSSFDPAPERLMPSLSVRSTLPLPYSTQEIASTRVDFPEPFGPMMPMTPSGNSSRAERNLR